MGLCYRGENHIWFHSQSKQAQGYMNAIFQEYKRQVDLCKQECKVVIVDDVDVPFTVVSTNFSIDEKGRYNRAKKKQEDKRLIDKYYEEEER